MRDFYAPEMEDPGDGDLLGAFADAVCRKAGHAWAPAGGGMLICGICEETQWDDAASPRKDRTDG